MPRQKLLPLCLYISCIAFLASKDGVRAVISNNGRRELDGEATINPAQEEQDWKEHMMDCIRDMSEADRNDDGTLNDQEYYEFCNSYGNRIFVSQNVIHRQHYWQLEELFEELVLENPHIRAGRDDAVYGILIDGAQGMTIAGLDDEDGSSSFLQRICNLSEKVIRKVGPKQAVADRSNEKCDLSKQAGGIIYHGILKPFDNATKEDIVQEALNENATVLIETFHHENHGNHAEWVDEVFEDGHEVEFWTNGTETSTNDDDQVFIVEDSPTWVARLGGLFGFGGQQVDEVVNDPEEHEQQRYLRHDVNEHYREAHDDDDDEDMEEKYLQNAENQYHARTRDQDFIMDTVDSAE